VKTLPLWVRALDAAAVVALLLGVFVLAFGKFSVQFSLTPVRLRSWPEILFVAGALAAVRHAAFPAQPVHRRIAAGARAWLERPPLNAAAVALASRLAVLLVGYLAVATIGIVRTETSAPESSDILMDLPARIDAGWYGGIALDGYSFAGQFARQQNLAFFPAFPMTMRVAGYPVGAFGPGIPHEWRMARVLWGGVLVSLLAFAWAGTYLWRLARDTIGEARAADAVALLAAYPFAIYFSAPYSESLFLLASIAAVYHFRRGEWLKAGSWGLLVGLARPNGCFLSAVLACLIAERWWRERATATLFSHQQLTRSLLAAAAPGIGMLAFSVYVHQITGAFFGWARLHEAWGRSYQGLAPVGLALGRFADDGLLRGIGRSPFDALNIMGLLFALLMIWPIFRRLGPAMAVFIVVNIVPPLLAGGLLSIGRLTATLFPAFIALAAIAPPRAVTPLLTAFAVVQGLAAALFFTWRPLF
jgi:hypothetical protein